MNWTSGYCRFCAKPRLTGKVTPMRNEDIRQRNLAALPAYLLADVETPVPGDATGEIEMLNAADGSVVSAVRTGGHVLPTASLIDPLGEAADWARTLEVDNVRLCFIYGCGSGYPLLAYQARKKPDTLTIIFERRPALFRALLDGVDLSPLLADPSVRWVIGDHAQMLERIGDALGGEVLLHCTRLAVHFTPPAHRVDKAFYLKLHEWLLDRLTMLTQSIGNSVHDTLFGLHNSLDNARSIQESMPLSELKGVYAGMPAFVVASGPSLDRNLDRLAGMDRHALILTAESALLPCLKRGVKPHAICVTERSPDVYHYHFAPATLPEGVALVGLSSLDPRIPASMPGPWLPVFRIGESSTAWLREALEPASAGLQGGMSSAHLAFELALYCGADPIIFVGQDLAFADDGRTTHSDASLYATSVLAEQVQRLRSEPPLTVMGSAGRPVRTTRLWLDFKTWFEHQIGRHPGVSFINATEGGAHIEGTKVMTLADALDHVPRAHPVPRLSELLAYRRAPVPWEKTAARLGSALAHLVRKTGELQSECRADLARCGFLLEACRLHRSHPGPALPGWLGERFSELGERFRRYTDDPHVSIYIQPLVYSYLRRLGRSAALDTLTAVEEDVRLHEQLFARLQRVLALMQRQFEAALLRLEKQGKRTNE
ncbi:motility associated factor glycosyltransferase family protein [Paenibacillus sp. IB182496]|uniref:Motility associated factor glycosyltransferase family protein n=1 Tax=Paenibacillus sabuli TaxID=2772509 RepID=A0A927BS43_9BACL|nr:6-hydroxymethylpterin diphosphokinase MptE-like protein [Paenibacillus sabuli]MBD2844519.1 motility associated factor glycosyltransferase family protein [Paenibacillus sabuli]